MDDPTPPHNRTPASENFRALETQLASLRALTKSLREDRPSWSDTIFHPARRARQEAEFAAATVAALKEFSAAMRQAFAEREAQLAKQDSTLQELQQHFSDSQQKELASIRTELNQLRQQTEETREQQQRLVRDHATELDQKMAESGREQAAKLEQLAASQKELANEFRERIQHLLDEQRVSIRQLALKASEDAVLADRARRALELKLDELTKRLPPG